MPRAVIDDTPERKELRSCPGGWVDLKRMPYGDWLHRTDISMQMQIAMEEKKLRNNSGGGASGTIAMQNAAVTTYEFSRCIVDHNLEDAAGNKLNFKNQATLQILAPRIGQEISDLINEMHVGLTEIEEGNFDLSSDQSSS